MESWRFVCCKNFDSGCYRNLVRFSLRKRINIRSLVTWGINFQPFLKPSYSISFFLLENSSWGQTEVEFISNLIPHNNFFNHCFRERRNIANGCRVNMGSLDFSLTIPFFSEACCSPVFGFNCEERFFRCESAFLKWNSLWLLVTTFVLLHKLSAWVQI